MRYLTHLNIPCLLIALALLSGCSTGRNAFSKAEKYEAEGKYEEAMYGYAEAFGKDPESSIFRARFLKARDAAANQRYRKGVEENKNGNYADALADFQAAYGFDPSQELYRQQVDLAARLRDARLAYEEGVDFEKGNKFKEASRTFARAVELHPDNKVYQAALGRVSNMRRSKLAGYELNLKSTKPITLKFKDAKLKEVFNILTRLSGINFVFDDGVKDQNITIYLENASFQQALELLANMNKLGRKVLNEGTVIIYPKSPDKIKQYEEMEMRTFYLNYLEAKKAINLIRGMIQVRKIQVSEESNSLLVRDTKDVIDVVDKIIEAHDIPEAEVVLDVEVMELTDTNAHNVGLLLSEYNVQAGLFRGSNLIATSLQSAVAVQTTTNPVTGLQEVVPTTQTAGPANLARIFTGNGVSGFMTLPTGQYNFQKNLAKGEVLSNPKIRVKNKEKSKFNVGTRVPITTTTLNGTISQVNVQYIDVGVKVSAEPTIQLNNQVVIKLGLEVSSVLSKESVGGATNATTVVTIGTRNLDTVLSLKDGETSIIGGLIERTNSNSKVKIFLLGDLPLIGPLISNSTDSKQKTELVLAITPRLVRGVTVPQLDVSAFMSGKEDDPTLVRPLAAFEEEPVFEGEKKQPSAQPGKSREKGVSTPADSKVSVPPSPATQPLPGAPAVETPPVPAPGNEAPAPAVPRGASSAENGTLEISIPPSVKVGRQLVVIIQANAVKNLLKAPFSLNYDPNLLEFVSVVEGDYFKSDGKETVFIGNADTKDGTVKVNLARKPEDGGVPTNSGSLAYAVFRAKQPGSAEFVFSNVSFVSADGKPYGIEPINKAVDVIP